MHAALPWIAAAAVSYLIGSVPFGFLVGRLRGIDIRTVGSGNIGATNVFRTLGKGWGVATFLLDAGKGVAATLAVPPAVWTVAGSGTPPPAVPLACAAAVLAGHSFPVFLRFKGGKGVATGLGAAFGLVPLAALAALVSWIAVFLATRYVSVASMVAAAVLAALSWVTVAGAGRGVVLPAVVTVLALLVVVKHRSNVVRLLHGTENRFSFTKRQAEEQARRREKIASNG